MNEEERTDIEKLFSKPLSVPPVFKRWMADQFALQVPNIPITQLFGGRAIERMLDSDNTPMQVTGGLETTVYSLPIKGKTVAMNGRVRVEMTMDAQSTDVGISLILRFKLGGTTIHTVTIPDDSLSGTVAEGAATWIFWNMNAYAAQASDVMVRQFRYVRGFQFPTVDLSQDTTLSITAQFSGGSPDANDIFNKYAVVSTVYNPTGS